MSVGLGQGLGIGTCFEGWGKRWNRQSNSNRKSTRPICTTARNQLKKERELFNTGQQTLIQLVIEGDGLEGGVGGRNWREELEGGVGGRSRREKMEGEVGREGLRRNRDAKVAVKVGKDSCVWIVTA